MIQLPEKNKAFLRKHGEYVSDRLTFLAHESKRRKLVIHDHRGKRFFELPLLFAIVSVIVLPIFAGIIIWFFLLYNFNAVIEKIQNER